AAGAGGAGEARGGGAVAGQLHRLDPVGQPGAGQGGGRGGETVRGVCGAVSESPGRGAGAGADAVMATYRSSPRKRGPSDLGDDRPMAGRLGLSGNAGDSLDRTGSPLSLG